MVEKGWMAVRVVVGSNNSPSKPKSGIQPCSEVEDGSSCRATQPGVSDAFLAGSTTVPGVWSVPVAPPDQVLRAAVSPGSPLQWCRWTTNM